MTVGVLVGYDRTETGETALDEAAAEATRRGVTLTVVHAVHREPRGADRGSVERATERLQARHSGLTVQTRALTGSLPKVFASLSADADLLVLAHHQHGALASLVSRTVARAACPTVVVRGGVHRPRGLILAVVEVGDGSEETLDFAFTEAALRGERLKAVTALEILWRRIYAAGVGLGRSSTQVVEKASARTEELLRQWRTKHPDVVTEHELFEGAPTVILTAATTYADLMVVSAHRHKSGEPGMRIGPLAQTLLLHSDCPVAVVPAD